MLMKSKLNEQVLPKACFAHSYTADTTAGATVGTVVDRLGYNSCIAILAMGDCSATTTTSITCTLYQSNDSTTTGTWTTLATATVSLSMQGTAVASIDYAFVDLSEAKRYINVSVDPGALGAASAFVTAVFVLGDADREPTW